MVGGSGTRDPTVVAQRGDTATTPIHKPSPSKTLADRDVNGSRTDDACKDNIHTIPCQQSSSTHGTGHVPLPIMSRMGSDSSCGEADVTLLESATLREVVQRVVMYFHPEPQTALLVAEGVDTHRLSRRKSTISRMGSRKLSRSSTGSGVIRTNQEDGEWAVELVERVVNRTMTVEEARKMFKTQTTESRLNLEWLLVRHTGFPGQVFSTHLWFIESTKLLEEFVVLFRTSSNQRDQAAVLAAVAHWITYHAQTTTDTGGALADLVAAADKVPALKDLPCMATLRQGFGTPPPTFEMAKPGRAPPAVTILHPANDDGGTGAGPAISSAVTDAIVGDPAWLLTTEARDLATQLTVLDVTLLQRIHPEEFRVQTRAGTKGLMVLSVLGTVISHTNNLTAQLVRLILAQPTAEERATATEHIVDVGRCLLEMNNFVSLFAVAGAITHAAIGRLKRTKAMLSKATRKVISMMELVLSPSSNHGAYRQRLVSAPHGLPYPGVVLKDLTGLYGLDGWSDDGLTLNVTKYRGVAKVLNDMADRVGRTAIFIHDTADQDEDIIRRLLELTASCVPADKLYALSLEREPRGSTSTPSGMRSRSKSVRDVRTRRRTISSSSGDHGGSTDRLHLAAPRTAPNTPRKLSVDHDANGSGSVVAAAMAAVAAVAEKDRLASASPAELETTAHTLVADLKASSAPAHLVKSVEALLAEMQRRVTAGSTKERGNANRVNDTNTTPSPEVKRDVPQGPVTSPGGSSTPPRTIPTPNPPQVHNGPVPRAVSESSTFTAPSGTRTHHSRSKLSHRTSTIEEEDEDGLEDGDASESVMESRASHARPEPTPQVDYFASYAQHFWVNGDDSDDSEMDLDEALHHDDDGWDGEAEA
eukprot:m.196304 g.196304  ORF g.196304 m.196304 type:complete len:874 (+) comp19750_c0_seq1:128-2749(+)